MRAYVQACSLAASLATLAPQAAVAQAVIHTADSSGVEFVTNGRTGTWTSATRWTAEQRLVIGAESGAPEYQFGEIGSVAVSRDGTIYVLDTQAREVRLFDSRVGTFVRSALRETDPVSCSGRPR